MKTWLVPSKRCVELAQYPTLGALQCVLDAAGPKHPVTNAPTQHVQRQNHSPTTLLQAFSPTRTLAFALALDTLNTTQSHFTRITRQNNPKPRHTHHPHTHALISTQKADSQHSRQKASRAATHLCPPPHPTPPHQQSRHTQWPTAQQITHTPADRALTLGRIADANLCLFGRWCNVARERHAVNRQILLIQHSNVDVPGSRPTRRI